MSELINKLIPIIIIVAAVILVLMVIMSWWKRVPQDKAGVVTGIKKKVITGGGGIVIPVINRIDYISLSASSLEITTEDSMSSQKVPINVVSTVVLKVKNDTTSILKAIERFNGKDIKEVKLNMEEIARQILEGKLREVVSTLSVEELYSNREKFANSVQEAAATELSTMGLEIMSFTIKDVTDENGYIKSLGVKQIAEKKKEADIAQAEAERERQIKVSEARRDGEQAKLATEAEISAANKEKLIKEQAYQKEIQTSKAQADVAYAIQKNITEKDVIQTEMDAELLRQERQKDIEQAAVQVEISKEVKNRELAERQAETAKASLQATVVQPAIAEREKQAQIADSEKYKKVAEADASAQTLKKQADAEAEATRMRGLATAETNAIAETKKAEAEATATKAKQLAEAEGIRAKQLAEAEGIRAKKLAEAEGIKAALLAEAEGMEKKAEAYNKYNKAAVTEMIVNILPEMAGRIAEPLARIEKITVIDSGSGNGENGVGNLAGNVGSVLAKTLETVKETTGIDFKEIIDADVLGKTTTNVNINGAGQGSGQNSMEQEVSNAEIVEAVLDKRN
ncbi:SPFH domain-containing protein [Hungatella sp.]|uniref:flotillin family protein n=1 Tax=Hungatella sp. TaxID=2613924 RepID=UPI003AB23A74